MQSMTKLQNSRTIRLPKPTKLATCLEFWMIICHTTQIWSLRTPSKQKKAKSAWKSEKQQGRTPTEKTSRYLYDLIHFNVFLSIFLFRSRIILKVKTISFPFFIFSDFIFGINFFKHVPNVIRLAEYAVRASYFKNYEAQWTQMFDTNFISIYNFNIITLSENNKYN